MKKCLTLLFLLPVAFASTVIGTTNITFADTIVAEVVSKIYNYPIVILPRDNLTTDVIQTLNKLNATEVVIIGGPYVVTPKVEVELKNLGLNVTRIWGVTRYETSALVALFFWNQSKYAVLITRELTDEGLKLKDVPLVKEAIERAIDLKAPLLITPPGKLESNVAEALLTLNVTKVYIYTLSNAPGLIKDLQTLNISYEIVTSTTNYTPRICENVTIIEVPPKIPWYELRELFLTPCIKIKFANITNVTEVKLKLMKKVKKMYRKMIKYQVEFRRILKERLQRLMKIVEREMKKYNITVNVTNPLKALDEVLILKWKEKLFWQDLKANVRELVKEIRKIRGRVGKIVEEVRKKVNNITKMCPQVYQPVICCDERGCREYQNMCEAKINGETNCTLKGVMIKAKLINQQRR